MGMEHSCRELLARVEVVGLNDQLLEAMVAERFLAAYVGESPSSAKVVGTVVLDHQARFGIQ